MENSFKSILSKEELKFIFVGGKGGVGKTTTSSALATLFAEKRKKVYLISTDPAHNLSDAFGQKFNDEPTLISGFNNLYAIEIDPEKTMQKEMMLASEGDNLLNGLIDKKGLSKFVEAIPGIDELIAFKHILSFIDNDDVDTIIFDTAPTGHTLKLLNMPKFIDKGSEGINVFKDKIKGIMSSFGINDESIFEKMNGTFQNNDKLKNILYNPKTTTFIAVCIPEYLSICETERLLQELIINYIDVNYIVCNQIVLPSNDCKKCLARFKIQLKYINQIKELYSDFNISFIPIQNFEIKGSENLKKYSQLLLSQLDIPSL